MNKKISKLALPLFLIWPFGAFLLSLFDLKSKSSAIVYVAFSALFAYSFHFLSTGADSHRIALYFINYSRTSSISDTIELFKTGGLTDLYLTLSFVVAKLFTTNPKVVFAWFGLVLGIFSYLSLRLLIENKIGKTTAELLVVAIVFFSFYPLPSVNGTRFNTAALLFFCSFIYVFVYDKKIWFLGLLGTMFIHFSYTIILPFVIVLWAIRPMLSKIKHNVNWVYWIFVLTLIISFVIPTNFISLGFLRNIDFISSNFGWKIDIYNSDEAPQLRLQRLKGSLFLKVSKLFGYLAKIYVLALVLYIKKVGHQIKVFRSLRSFHIVILLFLSFGFLASSVPSGGRFLTIGYLLFFYLFYQIYNLNAKLFPNTLILLLLPVFALNILFYIGYLSITLTDPVIWFGNVFLIIHEGIGYNLPFHML